jgi:hypothetical protein
MGAGKGKEKRKGKGVRQLGRERGWRLGRGKVI